MNISTTAIHQSLPLSRYDAQLGNWTILETKVPERPSRGAAMFIDNMDLCT